MKWKVATGNGCKTKVHATRLWCPFSAKLSLTCKGEMEEEEVEAEEEEEEEEEVL
jgi:hypothetical protein